MRHRSSLSRAARAGAGWCGLQTLEPRIVLSGLTFDNGTTTLQIEENLPGDTTIGAFLIDPPYSGYLFSYSLVPGAGSTDNAYFTIDGVTLKTVESFNFEAKSTYTIRVEAADLFGRVFDNVLTVTVSDVNEAPVDFFLSNAAINENIAIGTTVGTLASADEDAGNIFTYSLVAGSGSTDNAAFAVAGSTLRTAALIDFETKATYNIRLRSTDQNGLFFEKAYVITVRDLGEAPGGADLALSAISINENVASGSNVGTLSTTYLAPAGETFTYSLVSGANSSDNSFFTISGSTLKTAATFNFENKNSYTIRLRSTDQNLVWFEEVFSIGVNDVNEAPTNVVLSNNIVNENLPANTAVGGLSTIDADIGNTHTYTLVPGVGSTDNGIFTLNGNSLRASTTFNYEVKSSYSIRIRATDQAGLYYEKVFSVNVGDVVEPQTDIALDNSVLLENQPIGTTVGNILITNPVSDSVYSYEFAPGVNDNASFTIAGSTLKTKASFNYELKSQFLVQILARDQFNLTFQKDFIINISDVLETLPDISLSNTSVDENLPGGTSVGTLGVTDPYAGYSFTYTLVAGAGDTDNAQFTIMGSATLKIATNFNFENKATYSIRVRASGAGGLTFEKSLTINVNNVNETPLDLALSNNSVSENLASNVVVGALTTSDNDINNSFTYSLVSGAGSTDNASFIIDSNLLRATATFNYEIKNTYTVRLRTTDQSGLTFEKSLTIDVADVGEAPTDADIALSSYAINENLPAGTTVGTLSTTSTGGTSFTYALVNGVDSTDNASFVLVGNQLRTTDTFNFESKELYTIRVRSTDQLARWYEEVLFIHVNDVNEPPTDMTLSGNTVAENSPVGTVIGTFSTTDADSPGVFPYTLVSGFGATDNASFTINGNNLLSAANLNFEVKNSYNIRVRSTDDGGQSIEKVFVVNVTDVVEAPADIALSNSTIAENLAGGTLVGDLSVTDPFASGTFTFTLVTGAGSTNNNLFTITGSALKTTGTFNFEAASVFSTRVRATEQGGLFIEKQFTISATNVNEAPTNLNLSGTTIVENQPTGSLVGTLSTIDLDASNTFTYTLVSGAGSTDNLSFGIVNDALVSATPFNFEAKNSYSVRIRATDQGGLYTENTFTVNVTDVPDIQGFVDSITPTALTGWAYDPVATGAPINVRVVVDTYITFTVPTTTLREDVNAAFNLTGTHGFTFNIPTAFSTGYHQFDVYRLDPTTGNVVELIGSKTLALSQNQNPIAFIDGVNSTSVFGWSYDPDSPSASNQVGLRIDGGPLTLAPANLVRADVNSAFGLTGNHGFSLSIPSDLAPGSHTLSIYALDAATSQATLVGTRTHVITAPVGYVDSLTATSLSGWAFDPDGSGSEISIRVDIDGTAYSTFTTADLRSDVNSVYNLTGNHGFSMVVPANLAPGSHTFNIYALDSATGNPMLIGTKSLAVTAPVGYVDVVNSSVVSGWAYDPDVSSFWLSIRVDIDDVTYSTFTTPLLRTDVNSAFGIVGNHGFAMAMPTLASGTHTVRVYALDAVTSQAVLLGSTHMLIIP